MVLQFIYFITNIFYFEEGVLLRMNIFISYKHIKSQHFYNNIYIEIFPFSSICIFLFLNIFKSYNILNE